VTIQNTDRGYLDAAHAYAVMHSAHPTKKVGALLLSANRLTHVVGTNRTPPGVKSDRDRPMDLFVEHAEREVIAQAARLGVATTGSTMYITWYPCSSCARAMVNAGVHRMVSSKRPDFGDPKWGKEFVASSQILAEGGITTEFITHA
jgi:dCMP deaminase